MFERVSVDLKSPLPSSTQRAYMFVVVDEFSRFPVAFPTADTSADSAIQCLTSLFTVFGTPEFVHSDQGTAFTSSRFKQFLLQNSCIAQSFCSAYNAPGNGQTERHGIIWKSVSMACHSEGIDLKNWETVLPRALHSVRSLLCTATNQTPHERFFKHPRRSANGQALSTWLLTSDKVLLRRFNRASKYEPLVDEVDLLHVTREVTCYMLRTRRSDCQVAVSPPSPFVISRPREVRAMPSGSTVGRMTPRRLNPSIRPVTVTLTVGRMTPRRLPSIRPVTLTVPLGLVTRLMLGPVLL